MIWSKETIKKILQDPGGKTGSKDNRYIIYRMLQSMYAYQTGVEQEHGMTTEDNGVGFNGVDAPFLSDVAKRSQQYKNLTPKQAAAVAKRLIKYAGQLENIAQLKTQSQLLICGYCYKVGHTQQTCPAYQHIEMGKQLQLTSTQEYPD